MQWYALMASRHPVMALSLADPDSHENAVNILNSVMNMVKEMKVGDVSWKPVQPGILIATKTVLDLQVIFLKKEIHNFLLNSRFSQDALESLFSCMRGKNPIPTKHMNSRIA